MSDEVTFDEAQQKLVDKLIGEARVKAREKAQADAEAKATKDREAAEEAALAAEAKWKELAERHETRVKELEPLAAKAEAFDQLVDGMLKDKIKELGDAAKKAMAALPESMSAIDKLNWLNQNEGLFQVVGDGVGTPNRPKPKPEDEQPTGRISKFPIRL